MAAQAGPRRPKRLDPSYESPVQYPYRDEDGVLLFEVVRWESPHLDKTFSQRRPHPTRRGTWIENIEGVRRVPYNLPDVHGEALPGVSIVYIVEGEKDADRLSDLGQIATCNPGGANKWRSEYSRHFDGLTVVIVADKDGDSDTGRTHARQVARSLRGIAASVRVVEAREGKDVSDHLDAGHGLDDLVPVEMDETEPSARWDLLLDAAVERSNDEGRNNACFWLVCRLRDNRYPEPEARRIVERFQERVAGTKSQAFPRAEAIEVFDKTFFTDARAPWIPEQGKRFTDLGNAERLVQRHGQDLHYVYAWKKWLVWDGKRWRPDETGEVERMAKATVRAIYQEAADDLDPDNRPKVAAWAKASEHHSRIKAMIELAKSEPGVAVLPSELDTNPMELNLLNGTLHLGAKALFEHRRDSLITKLAPVEWNPEAKSETWDDFLRQILPDEPDRSYLQRIIGYALTGDVREQTLFVFFGFGSNGKSTVMEAVRSMLGDYAQQASSELFLVKRPGAIPTDVARLQGARFVTASETEDGSRLAEAQIKQLTGGDRVTARRLYADPTEFDPTHKLFLTTNHKPQVRGNDEAMWRRIRLFPFSVTIKDADRDDALPATLRRPHILAAILRWAVEGCDEWQRIGLGTSPNVVKATAEYREESDVFGQFIEDVCSVGLDHRVRTGDLYDAYKDWAKENGYAPMTAKSFGLKLKERFFEPCKLGKARGWRGLTLAGLEDLDAAEPAKRKLRVVPGGGS